MLEDSGCIPKVSIGLPVYNGGKYLAQAIESLLSQTYIDFELIISDNASSDDTAAICHGFEKRDHRVRYIRQSENMGAAANFKFVLRHARGEYFMWAAHDDLWHEQFIEKCMEVFDDDPLCDLVFSEYIIRNLVDGTSVRHRAAFSNSPNSRTNYLVRLLNPIPSLVYGLHRKSSLQKVGVGNFDYADLHLTHQYAVHFSVKMLPQCYYTCGTNGYKGLYSITGKPYLSCTEYMKNEWSLLYSKFSFFQATFLWAFSSLLAIKNTRSYNKMIKSGQFSKKRRAHPSVL